MFEDNPDKRKLKAVSMNISKSFKDRGDWPRGWISPPHVEVYDPLPKLWQITSVTPIIAGRR
jgi:hypothetical protein